MKGGTVATIKNCENCGAYFPTDYARVVHQCSKGNHDSDEKVLAFLRGMKERKEEKDGKLQS